MSDNGDGTLDLNTNSMGDHNLWVQANIGYVEEQNIRGTIENIILDTKEDNLTIMVYFNYDFC